MQDGLPKVCIGVAVRNGEAILPDVLDSLVRQSFPGFVVVVSDDASTDSSFEIARQFAARDRRIHCTRVDRGIGAAANRNRVFGFCQSPYFAWVDPGDLPAPGWLERCVGLLEADPGVVFAHTAQRQLGEDGRPLTALAARHPAEGTQTADRIREVLRHMAGTAAGPGLMRSEALRQTGLIAGFAGGEAVLLTELALLGRFRQADEALCGRRGLGGPVARRLPPRVRLAAVKAVAASPLGPLQRLWCLGVAARAMPAGGRRTGR